MIEKMEPITNSTPILGAMNEERAKINELIDFVIAERDATNAIVEKCARLEVENDKLLKRVTTAENALAGVIARLEHHSHNQQGTAVVPLAL